MDMVTNDDFLIELEDCILPRVTSKNINYYNVAASFDIETSSFYQDNIVKSENKRAIMYIWQFGIQQLVTFGRTWEDFLLFIKYLSEDLQLNEKNRLVVWVHNLSYEWQFIRKLFTWDEVFLMEERVPVKARTGGIEFRCSYKLSNKSLASVGKDLESQGITGFKKKTGDLDYSKIRTPATSLTEEELGYCEYDIRVLNRYIEEKIKVDGDITRIPLTNTGYVRNKCREICFRTIWEVQDTYGAIENRCG